MSALSDYSEQKLLDKLLNKVDFTAPTTYVSLHTAATTDAGGGTEVSGGSYARKLVYENANGSTPKWNLAAVSGTGYRVDNLNAAAFVTATADWGTVTHTAVWDALTVGNMLVHGALTASKVVQNGDTFQYNAGDLDIDLA